MASSAPAVKSFQRILQWLDANKKARAVLPSLRQPASAKAIAEFEAKTKLKLPSGLAAIYHLHDGQDEEAANKKLSDDATIESGLFPSIEGENDLPFLLVPLKELARNTRGSHMPGWVKGWIPFGDNYGGDNIVLDARGRVLQFNHEYGGAYVLAPTFDAYLESIADGLAKKKIAWDDDSGLHYKKALDWEDLVEKKKVEYSKEFMEQFEEEEEEEEPKPAAPKKSSGTAGTGGMVDSTIVGKWQVIDIEPKGVSISAITGHFDFIFEFKDNGDIIIRPPKGSPVRPQKNRYLCNRSTTPPQIDLHDAKFTKDIRCEGVYQIEGDQLLLVTGQLHEPRATSLDWTTNKTDKPWIVRRLKRA